MWRVAGPADANGRFFMQSPPAETILIVDDEESVRETFREWLAGAGLGCTILAASDAESALRLANQHAIDLAVLDWNLGAGDDGLHLLQDLVVFHPAIVAILVTGYANQATPLDAMRMGVRDYLDKNHDLNRETFLRAVRKQLDQIRPAKRARVLQESLEQFRATVEKAVPLVQSAAALAEPVPLPEAVRGLVRFAVQATHAADGVLLVRHYDAARQPAEWQRAYDAAGKETPTGATSFAQSLAGAAVSRQEACVMNRGVVDSSNLSLYPFERERSAYLVAPMLVAPGVQAVLELFDKPGGFSAEDQRVAQTAAELGADLIRHALGQRGQQQMLLDALAAALGASDRVAKTLSSRAAADPPPAEVLDRLRQGLAAAGGDPVLARTSVELAEAIRELGAKHGPASLRHCLALVDNLRGLLDDVTGA
jgi:two-component system nitrogen regulation response regulator NtrX